LSFVTAYSLEFLQVQVVILISIDPPIAPNPNLRITVQLWRGYDPARSVRQQSAAQRREARLAWQTDWTNAATPMYLELADIFIDQASVPAYYGNNTRVALNTTDWRLDIIDNQ
jgi:hypothetical protein